MCMYTHVCVSMHVYTHVCVSMHVYTHVCVSMHVYTHVCVSFLLFAFLPQEPSFHQSPTGQNNIQNPFCVLQPVFISFRVRVFVPVCVFVCGFLVVDAVLTQFKCCAMMTRFVHVF